MRSKHKAAALILAAAAALSAGSINAAAADNSAYVAEINSTNFPDDTFRSYVSKNFDSNGDGWLSQTECLNVESINVSGSSSSKGNIQSLKGIEYFTNLQGLNCAYNEITSLDVSNCTALTGLSCDNNSLTSLDLSNCTDLKYVYCHNSRLSSLDVSNCTALTNLTCSWNRLTSLDVSNCTALTYLYCGNNSLVRLDVSNCSFLEALDCACNNFTNLDLSNCTALTSLFCGGNNFTCLDVSNCNALTYLSCDHSSLTSLDVSRNTALKTLYCNANQLTKLDVSKNTLLEKLVLEHNPSLGSIDVCKNTALIHLDVFDCGLTSLDISNNVNLEELLCYSNSLTSLNTANNPKLQRILCDGNSIAELDFTNNKELTFIRADDDTVIIGDPRKEVILKINETNIPDEKFRQYIADNIDIDKSGDLSLSEVNSVKFLDVSGTHDEPNTISDLTSIEYFTNLENLRCDYTKVSSLDLSNCTSLRYLSCNNNNLTSLNVSNCTDLTELYCYNNNISKLNLTNNLSLEIVRADEDTVIIGDHLKNLQKDDKIRVTGSNREYVNGDLLPYGLGVWIGMDIEDYVNNKVLINGKEIELTENGDGYWYCTNYFVNSDLDIQLVPEKWSDERMANYVTLNADENVTVWFYNSYMGSISAYDRPIKNGGYIGKNDKICLRIPSSVYSEKPDVYINGTLVDCSLNNDGMWQIWAYDVPDDSDVLRISIGGNSIYISKEPADVTVIEGLDTTLSVAAEGTGLSYQWQKKIGDSWVNVDGANRSELVLNDVTYDMNGSTYRCVISKGSSSVISASASVNVKPAENVTQAEVEKMSIDEIIGFVNTFNSRYDINGQKTVVFTSAQMYAVERVLAYDLGI